MHVLIRYIIMDEAELKTIRQRLVADFPEIQVGTVARIGSGWHHVALEVNGNIIFRLPRGAHVKDLSGTMAYETAVLHKLGDKLPVAIPSPEYIAPGNAYFGYPKLAGKILSDVIQDFDEKDWRQLMEDWTDVAAAIHAALSVDEARKLGVPDFEGPDTAMVTKLFGLHGIDLEVLDLARETVVYFAALDMKRQHHVFAHNDLQFQNMLIDPATKRLSGLIDWTDICVAPVAHEFATGEWLERNLLDKLAAAYRRKTGVRVDTVQARMWRALEELSDYVEETESGETDEAAQTMERIRRLITRV
jgi:aminoglycoside phosphotransferase (APT) family kinase protein